MLIHPLFPTFLAVSTPNTIHYSRLTVCLLTLWILNPAYLFFIWLSVCE